MHRFHVPSDQVNHIQFPLPASEAHHAVKVLRCRPQEVVEVLDGRGRRLKCQITDVARREVHVAVLDEVADDPPPVRIVLYSALAKGRAFDLILEKAAEIGVSEVVPVICERSVAVPAEDQAAAKVERWQQAVVAAMKQCGRSWMPVVRPMRPFYTAIAHSDECSWNLVAALDDAARPLKEWLRGVTEPLKAGASVGVWIGPEGDFSESEYEVMRSRRFAFARLTDAVLRSETAALYVLACLHYEVGF